MKHALRVLAIAAATMMAPASAPAQPAVGWLVIVDDVHLDFRNTGRLRDLLTATIDELVRESDQVALYSTHSSSVSVQWTDDRTEIDGFVREIAGASLDVSEIVATMRGRTPVNEVDYRATFAVSRAYEVMASLGHADDRRIGVIYISNGYVDRTPSLTRPGARLPILALDPRILPGAFVDMTGVDVADWKAYWTATRNSLRTLSEQSGGFALAEGYDLSATLARFNDLVRR